MTCDEEGDDENPCSEVVDVERDDAVELWVSCVFLIVFSVVVGTLVGLSVVFGHEILFFRFPFLHVGSNDYVFFTVEPVIDNDVDDQQCPDDCCVDVVEVGEVEGDSNCDGVSQRVEKSSQCFSHEEENE